MAKGSQIEIVDTVGGLEPVKDAEPIGNCLAGMAVNGDRLEGRTKLICPRSGVPSEDGEPHPVEVGIGVVSLGKKGSRWRTRNLACEEDKCLFREND